MRVGEEKKCHYTRILDRVSIFYEDIPMEQKVLIGFKGLYPISDVKKEDFTFGDCNRKV